jgi:nucleotide-binding universal stress UspA family protein
MYWRNPPMHNLLGELGHPTVHGSGGVDEFSLDLPAGPVADRIPELLAAVALASDVRADNPIERHPMFASIIVGIDGTEGGRDALALAKNLAGPTTRILLVTAFPHDEHASRGSSPAFESLLREDTDKELLKSASDDPRCRIHAIPDSSPGRALHDEAERERADLIVVGSCNHGVIARVLLGDVSRATLHGAPCPVAVAPHGYDSQAPGAIKTIGVGFNGTDESRAALAFSVGLATSTNATLRLLSAVTSPASMGPAYMYAYNWSEVDAENRLAAELAISRVAENLSVPTQTETVATGAGVALERLSEHVDLIVTGSRGWGASHRVVLGSTADHLTHHAHCPVIVVPSPVEDRAGSDHTVDAVMV